MKKTKIALAVVLSMLAVLTFAFAAIGCNGKKEVESLELNTDGCKLEFYVDDDFTADGLVITAHYVDGKTGTIDIKDCLITAPNMNVEGEKFVRVKYGEIIVAYKVNVVQRPIEWAPDFTVDPVNGEKTYELKALDSHLVSAGSNLGPSKEHPTWSVGGMDVGDRIAFRIKAESAGIADVYLNIDHSAIGGKAVTDIFELTVDGEPYDTKAVFYGGEPGHSCVSWYCFQKTLLGRFDLAAGQHMFILKCKGGATNFKSMIVDYKVLESIELNTDEVKKSFKVDEYFDQSELVVKANYLNDYTEYLEIGDYKIEKPDTTKVGTQTVKITFGDKEISYDVEVTEQTATLTGLAVDASNAKTDYYLGKSLSRTDLIVNATYDDGSTIRIDHSLKYTNEEDKEVYKTTLALAGGTSTKVPTTPGEYDVNVTYGGMTATYKVNVAAALTLDPSDLEKEFVFNAADAVLGSGIKTSSKYGDVYNIKNKKKITFHFNSLAAGQARLYVNYDHNVFGLIKTHMTIKVNGKTLSNENKFATPSFLHKHAANGHCYAAPTLLGLVDVNEGMNKIEFTFKADGTGMKNLVFAFGEEKTDPDTVKEYIFEAENGILSRCTAESNTQFGASGAANVGSTVMDDPETEEFDGSLVTIRIYAEAAETVKFGIRVSSATKTTLDKLVGLLKVNGKEFDLSVIDVEAGTPTGSQWFIWTVAVVEGIELNAGLNIVEISPIANFDAIAVESKTVLKEKLDSEVFYMVDAGTYAMYPEHSEISSKNPEWIGGFVQDDIVKFTVSTDKDVSTIFTYYMDHGPDNFGNGTLDSQAFPYAADLFDFTIEHNGESVPFTSWLKFPYCPQKGDCTHGGFHNLEARLGLLDLKAGETTITVKFKKASLSNLHGIGFYSTEPVTAIVPDERLIPDDPDRPIMRLYTFEAENGIRSNCNAMTDASSSGKGRVANTGEQASVMFRVYAVADVTVTELTIKVNSGGGNLIDKIGEININSEVIDISEIVVSDAGEAVIQNVNLIQGLNTIVCKSIRCDFDCIIIKSDVRLTETSADEQTVMLDGTAAQKPDNVVAIAGHDGWVNGIAKNDVLTWTIDAEADTQAILSIFIDSENCYGGTINNPWVNSRQLYEITISHGGEDVTLELSAGMIWWGGALGADYNDAEIKLGVLDLAAGETTISIKFISDTVPNFHGLSLCSTGTINTNA